MHGRNLKVEVLSTYLTGESSRLLTDKPLSTYSRGGE